MNSKLECGGQSLCTMNMRDCFKPPEKVRRLQGNILNDLSRTCKAPLLLIPCLAPERQNSRKSSAQNRMKTLKLQFENSTDCQKEPRGVLEDFGCSYLPKKWKDCAHGGRNASCVANGAKEVCNSIPTSTSSQTAVGGGV